MPSARSPGRWEHRHGPSENSQCNSASRSGLSRRTAAAILILDCQMRRTPPHLPFVSVWWDVYIVWEHQSRQRSVYSLSSQATGPVVNFQHMPTSLTPFRPEIDCVCAFPSTSLRQLTRRPSVSARQPQTTTTTTPHKDSGARWTRCTCVVLSRSLKLARVAEAVNSS